MAGRQEGPTRPSRRLREMEERKRLFLEAFRRTGTEEAARESTGVGESTVRRWKGADDAFLAAFKATATGGRDAGAVEGARRRFTGRKGVFMETLEEAGALAAALRAAEATMKELRRWLREDAEFREVYLEAKGRIRARALEELERRIAAGEPVRASGRKQVFLKKVGSVGTTTGGCEAAGISLKTLNGWLEEDKGFAEGFEEAKLRFHDRIEETIVQRIEDGKNGGLLQFKARAELPEKYGKGRKEAPPKGQPGLTWEDIDRAAREPYDVGEC